jgi:hypothetical protein
MVELKRLATSVIPAALAKAELDAPPVDLAYRGSTSQ